MMKLHRCRAFLLLLQCWALLPSSRAFSPSRNSPLFVQQMRSVENTRKPPMVSTTTIAPSRSHTTLFESLKPNDKDKVPSVTTAVSVVTDALSELSIFASPQSFARIRDNLTSGDVGARGEVYFVTQVFLILCILYGSIPMLGDLLTFVLGPCTLLGGIVTAVLGLKDLGPSNLSPWPKVPETDNASLITNGIYGEVRHPIYTGLLATCIGFSVWSGSAMRVVLTFILYFLLDLKSDYEEQSLVQKFGNSYKKYQKQVKGKFVPEQLIDGIKNWEGITEKKNDKGSKGGGGFFE